MMAVAPMLISCKTGPNESTRTISAETLAEKYAVSVEAARREFDGKELVVKGYVSSFVSVPKGDETEGMLLLGSDKKSLTQVQCWFSKYESAEFSDIAVGQPIVVKGIFNGESGLVVKFCKRVQEQSPDGDRK